MWVVNKVVIVQNIRRHNSKKVIKYGLESKREPQYLIGLYPVKNCGVQKTEGEILLMKKTKIVSTLGPA
ncbi:hypothetical protein, partial [Lentilactobacillus hilgardii]